MDVDEFYRRTRGSLQKAREYLKDEDTVITFLYMFKKDESFAVLKASMESEEWDAAFRAAHTLKGICANLGFKSLFEVSYEITEALRAGDMEQAKVMWPGVQACYARVDNALNQLEQ